MVDAVSTTANATARIGSGSAMLASNFETFLSLLTAQLKNQLDIAKRQYENQQAGIKSQLAPQEAEVDQRKAAYELRVRQLEDLKVKAKPKTRAELKMEAGEKPLAAE